LINHDGSILVARNSQVFWLFGNFLASLAKSWGITHRQSSQLVGCAGCAKKFKEFLAAMHSN